MGREEDLFEGIDLEYLAGSEEPADSQEEGAQASGVDYAEFAEQDTPGKTKDTDDDLGFELDYIANLEEQDEDLGFGEGKKIDEVKRTPESKGLSSSPLTSLTSALHEEGVLSSLSEKQLAEIKSGTDLVNAIRDQIRQNEYADLSGDQKEYLDALRTGVPDEGYRQAKHSADMYSKIDAKSLDADDAETFRTSLIVNDFLSKGFSQQEAEKYAKRSLDLGEDIDDAKEALGRLKQSEQNRLSQMSEQAKKQQEAAQTAHTQRIESLKTKVNNSSEIVPGVKFNQQTKDRVFELMTTTAGFDSGNNPMNAVVKEMVENPDYLVKMFYLHHITNGLTDWDKLNSAAKRNAVNKLDESLRAQDARIRTGTDSTRSTPPGTSGVIDAIRGFL